MSKSILRNVSTKDAMSFDDLYEEISSNWQARAEDLIRRRDARLKRANN